MRGFSHNDNATLPSLENTSLCEHARKKTVSSVVVSTSHMQIFVFLKVSIDDYLVDENNGGRKKRREHFIRFLRCQSLRLHCSMATMIIWKNIYASSLSNILLSRQKSLYSEMIQVSFLRWFSSDTVRESVGTWVRLFSLPPNNSEFSFKKHQSWRTENKQLVCSLLLVCDYEKQSCFSLAQQRGNRVCMLL